MDDEDIERRIAQLSNGDNSVAALPDDIFMEKMQARIAALKGETPEEARKKQVDEEKRKRQDLNNILFAKRPAPADEVAALLSAAKDEVDIEQQPSMNGRSGSMDVLQRRIDQLKAGRGGSAEEEAKARKEQEDARKREVESILYGDDDGM